MVLHLSYPGQGILQSNPGLGILQSNPGLGIPQSTAGALTLITGIVGLTSMTLRYIETFPKYFQLSSFWTTRLSILYVCKIKIENQTLGEKMAHSSCYKELLSVKQQQQLLVGLDVYYRRLV